MDYLSLIEKQVLNNLDKSRVVSDEEVLRLIDEAIITVLKNGELSVSEKIRLRSNVYNSMRGLDILSPLLEDEDVTEIMINGYENIFIEKKGVIKKLNSSFRSADKLNDVIQTIVSGCNRVVNESSPIVDARLLDGSRVNVVLKPIALNGPVMTIRKFPKEAMTIDKLIDIGSLDKNVAMLLKYMVMSGYNIIISGGTGSGKTTFLNALSSFIPKTERIITIEDAAELQIEGVDNLVSLEVRNANVEGAKAISIKDLIKSSLRMRPDRIIVGEVRGEEAIDMLQALNTGHDGSISTAHANSAKDMLTRLETMVLMGFDMPIRALRGQIASAIEIIVHLKRLRDHSRKVVEIVEVLDLKEDEIMCNTLFKYQEDNVINSDNLACEDAIKYGIKKTTDSPVNSLNEDADKIDSRVTGQLVKWHELKQVNKLKEAGYYDNYCSILKNINNGVYISANQAYEQ
ncbi:MAG: CpaF family protein [Lachnospiraceae bacterium]|nr:CpaF family protein [Lachnospiraceae bacterium]